jgi:hypothetical protein
MKLGDKVIGVGVFDGRSIDGYHGEIIDIDEHICFVRFFYGTSSFTWWCPDKYLIHPTADDFNKIEIRKV